MIKKIGIYFSKLKNTLSSFQREITSVTKNIDIVFHLAAHVGGIGLNKEKPGELFYDNILMGTYLLDEARKNNVEKFVTDKLQEMSTLSISASKGEITPKQFINNFINLPASFRNKALDIYMDANKSTENKFDGVSVRSVKILAQTINTKIAKIPLKYSAFNFDPNLAPI